MRQTLPWPVVGAVAIGMMLGFALGGVAPRAALVEAEAEVERLEAELEAAPGAPSGWRSALPGFDRLFRPSAPASSSDEAAPADDEGLPPTAARSAPNVPTADAGLPRARWGDRWRERRPDERVDSFRQAAAIQRIRRAQSREALRQQAELDDEEMARVDEVFEEMNGELETYGPELLALATSEAPPSASNVLGLTHEVTGILHRAQLSLESVLGPGRAARTDASALEVWNHLDLERLDPDVNDGSGGDL